MEPTAQLPMPASTKKQTSGGIAKNRFNDDFLHENKPLNFPQFMRAYGATVFVMGSVVNIVASIVTVVLFFILSLSPPPSLWFASACGSLSTYLVFLFLALFCCPYIGTIQGASTRSFSQLKTRLYQLQARLVALGIVDKNYLLLADKGSKNMSGSLENDGRDKEKNGKKVHDHSQESHDQNTLVVIASADKNFKNVAEAEARDCYYLLGHDLNEYRAGLRWVTGMGYINAWGQIHRIEEALVKIEPVQTAFCGTVHDRLAIQDSNIGKREELLNKLTRATADLYQEGASYFRERLSDEDSELIKKIVEAVNTVIPTGKPRIDIDSLEPEKSNEQKDAARLVLSEVRRTLNEYRDGIWEGLLHERNRVMSTAGITGLITHILLCITIVMIGVLPGNNKPLLMAAVAYYLVGAIAGLFFRFWREMNLEKAIDDFGLSAARLLATPLISGLAGIGGVMISLLLSDALANNQAFTFADIFQILPTHILTAAAFGLAPGLLVSGLQQKVAKYSSDLRSSKSGGLPYQEDEK